MIKKAFEAIDRNKLVKKSENMGVCGTILERLKSYLYERCQRVKFGGKVSQSKIIENGMPQGMILGSLLFILYKNDIVKYCHINLFADNMMLYVSGSNHYDLIDNIEGDLKTMLKVNV